MRDRKKQQQRQPVLIRDMRQELGAGDGVDDAEAEEGGVVGVGVEEVVPETASPDRSLCNSTMEMMRGRAKQKHQVTTGQLPMAPASQCPCWSPERRPHWWRTGTAGGGSGTWCPRSGDVSLVEWCYHGQAAHGH